MIRIKESRQNMRLGIASCVAGAVTYISVDTFQRINGYTDPTFFFLGVAMLLPAILLLLASRKRPAPDRPINPLVFVCAAIIAAACIVPTVSAARLYADFKPYLHIRAWILAVGGFLTVFFLAACILSLFTMTRRPVDLDHQ